MQLHSRPVRGAVRVDVALDLLAAGVWVSHEACRAAALGRVIDRGADGVDGAGVVDQAVVDALVVVANLVVAAVVVDHALN